MYYICSCTVLSGWTAAQLHTMPLISCYQCYPVLSCVTVCFCVLPGLAAAQLHSMPPLLCYQCYPVLSCVIACFCVLSGLAAAQIHSMPPLLYYQCYVHALCYNNIDNTVKKQAWYVTVLLLPTLITHSNTL